MQEFLFYLLNRLCLPGAQVESFEQPGLRKVSVLMAGGWNEEVFKVPFKPNYSLIL